MAHFYTVLRASARRFDPQSRLPARAPSGPISSRHPAGIPLAELALRRHGLDAAELRATPATLRLQAEVAAARRPAAARRQPAARGRAGAAARRHDPRDLHRSPPAPVVGRELEAWAERLEALDAPLTAAFVRDAGAVYASGAFLLLTSARLGTSRREQRELRREVLIEPLAELGLVAMNGPNDPEPSLVIEDGPDRRARRPPTRRAGTRSTISSRATASTSRPRARRPG